ncbi:hypothetical protein MRX96_043772 [Rhipicephalus microplus]
MQPAFKSARFPITREQCMYTWRVVVPDAEADPARSIYPGSPSGNSYSDGCALLRSKYSVLACLPAVHMTSFLPFRFSSAIVGETTAVAAALRAAIYLHASRARRSKWRARVVKVHGGVNGADICAKGTMAAPSVVVAENR